MLLQELKQECPKAWKEFSTMAQSILVTQPKTSSLLVEDLPFELAFGLILQFLKENDLEFDYNNLPTDQYAQEIKDIFSNFEGMISHYS